MMLHYARSAKGSGARVQNSNRSSQDRLRQIQGDSVRETWGVDAPQSERRSIRRDPPPRPAALGTTDDVLQLRLAEELDYARRLLDAMGDELANDATIVARHPRSLQSVDIVGQTLGHIASVIRCDDPDAAVDRIGMVELKARLTRRGAL